jgi:hypothetical protein
VGGAALRPERSGRSGPALRSRLYSRKSSLMPVLARVWASTVFTITAQWSDGRGEPSGSSLPGSEPGTTRIGRDMADVDLAGHAVDDLGLGGLL